MSASDMALSGEPLTWYLPSASSMSSGAASSRCAAILLGLVAAPSRPPARPTRRRPPASASRRCPCRTAPCWVSPWMTSTCSGVRCRAGRPRSGRSRSRGPGRAARCRCRRVAEPDGCTRTVADSQNAGLEADAAAGRPRATARGRRSRCRWRSRCRGRRPARAAPPAPCGTRRGRASRAACRACRRSRRSRRSTPIGSLGGELLLRDEVLPPQLEPGPMPSSSASWSIITSIQCVASGRPAPRMASVANLFVNTPGDVGLDGGDLVAAAHHEGARGTG